MNIQIHGRTKLIFINIFCPYKCGHTQAHNFPLQEDGRQAQKKDTYSREGKGRRCWLGGHIVIKFGEILRCMLLMTLLQSSTYVARNYHRFFPLGLTNFSPTLEEIFPSPREDLFYIF